jgi:REG-2-like HAD superfamily hydrolase
MRTGSAAPLLWRFAARALLEHPARTQAARGFAAAAAAAHRPHGGDAPLFRGVLIDAAGTLLVPSEPSAGVYLRYAKHYGVTLSEAEILHRYRRCVRNRGVPQPHSRAPSSPTQQRLQAALQQRPRVGSRHRRLAAGPPHSLPPSRPPCRAYNSPWGGSSIRYVGDGRPFWRHIVSQATGCSHEQMFEDIYGYYAEAGAWRVAPGALHALQRLRQQGVKLAVVSNFDTRLQPLLQDLGLLDLFDAVVVSAEVGAEKPNPVIFEAAATQLRLQCSELLHVGDDRRNDVWGARDAGICAWLWGTDVHSFQQVADRVLRGAGAPGGRGGGEEEDEDDGLLYPQMYALQ